MGSFFTIVLRQYVSNIDNITLFKKALLVIGLNEYNNISSIIKIILVSMNSNDGWL